MQRTVRHLSITLAVGTALGILTSFGQTFIPAPLNQLANSYSIWLLFSFVVGYCIVSYKRAAVAGIIVQYVAIIFYYVASSLRFDMQFVFAEIFMSNLVWIIGGTVVGPVAAVAGAMVRNKATYYWFAIAFMTGLFLSEALYLFITLRYVAEGVVFTVSGLAFLLMTFFIVRFPVVRTLLAVIVLTVLMYVGYAYVLAAVFS